MVALYSVAVFLSAALLFVVQPLAARRVLPALGGTPGVWNTSMLFFQGVLLLGYLYAHVVTARLGLRRQLIVHGALLGLACLALPLGRWGLGPPPSAGEPSWWLLGTLSLMVGAPFLAVSATAPLLQRWFSRAGHARSADPYFLYAASNAGSMLGLLGYPLIVEPALRLRDQALGWSAGFVLLALLVIGAGAAAIRGRGAGASAPGSSSLNAGAPRDAAKRETSPRDRWRERVLWVLLALAPSSLMLGATTFITTDVASAPLLWAIPLAIYLASFMLVFSRAGASATRIAARALPIAAVALAVLLLVGATRPILVIIGLHLLVLAAGALACHGRLAALRPRPERLTEYYLLMSVGGALGGAFNALAAPLLFDRVLEYPIALLLACALGMGAGAAWAARKPDAEGAAAPAAGAPAREARPALQSGLFDVACLLAVVLVSMAADLLGALIIPDGHEWTRQARLVFAVGVPSVLVYLYARSPRRFAMGLSVLLALAMFRPSATGSDIYRERTFFGVHRVTTHGNFHYLVHGTTTHGIQDTRAEGRREPLSYYHRRGPIGQVFAHLHADATRAGRPLRVGFIGLGTGVLSAYGRPGDEFTFYEIDPEVERIARDTRLFTYVTDSRARVDVRLGDGRLRLGATPEGSYDLIVVDAFSSDAIPAHLLTTEAVALYASRLRPGGMLAFHVSNRYLELRPLVRGIAGRLGMAALAQRFEATDTEEREGKQDSEWVVLARSAPDLGTLTRDPRWESQTPGPADPVWTDDAWNLLSVWKR